MNIKYIIYSLLTLIVLPIGINYFTDTFKWIDVLNFIWNYGWIVISIFLFIIVAYITYSRWKENKIDNHEKNEKKITEKDKTIFLKIIDTLKLEDGQIQRILKDNYSTIPQNWDIHQRFHFFIEERERIINHIVDKELNFFLDEFTNSLHEYLNKFNSVNDFDENRNMVFISLNLKKYNPTMYYETMEELDNLANNTWDKLTRLIAFARKKDIF